MSFKKNIVPQAGDLLRVHRKIKGFIKPYYHYGIAVDENTVIHFTALNSDLGEDGEPKKIIISSLSRFLLGDTLEVWAPYNSPYKPEEVVERARSYIDSAIFRRKKYNFVTNNCEHFARYVYYGKVTSVQVRHWTTGIIGAVGIALADPLIIGAVVANNVKSKSKPKNKLKKK